MKLGFESRPVLSLFLDPISCGRLTCEKLHVPCLNIGSKDFISNLNNETDIVYRHMLFNRYLQWIFSSRVLTLKVGCLTQKKKSIQRTQTPPPLTCALDILKVKNALIFK